MEATIHILKNGNIYLVYHDCPGKDYGSLSVFAQIEKYEIITNIMVKELIDREVDTIQIIIEKN